MTLIDLVTKADLDSLKKELLEALSQLSQPAATAKPWLRSAEVRKLLHISPGTLQNIRINGTLRYTKIGSIFYYKAEDIHHLLERPLQRWAGWMGMVVF